MGIHKTLTKPRKRGPIRLPGLLLIALLVIAGSAMIAAVPAAAQQSALDFDGQDDYAFASLVPGKEFESFTLMARVKLTMLNAPTGSFRALVRAVEQRPPDDGYINTSENIFILFQYKDSPSEWGFELSNVNGESIEIKSNRTLNDVDWFHLAVTYDHITGKIKLYQDGQLASSGEDALAGPIPPVLSLWFGRWVSAIYGQIGQAAAYTRPLSETEIKKVAECGAMPLYERYAYWIFDQDGGSALTDAWNGLDGELGSGNSTPLWTQADYLLPEPDSDGDGVADDCDNCIDFANADQVDQDGDGSGNACDDCNLDGPGGTGLECGWAQETLVTSVEDLNVELQFQWGSESNPAPTAYMVPQDEENTVVICFDWETNEQLPFNCGRSRSHTIAAGEENVPGGDLEEFWSGRATTTTVDLRRWYDVESFDNGAECQAVYMASTFDRDYNWVTGECETDFCIEPIPCEEGQVPGEDCFPYGQVFVGQVASEPFYVPRPNEAPVAVDDNVATDEDTAKAIYVLVNDYDPDDKPQPLDIASFTQPANGDVVDNGDGSFTYTPAENYNGPDSFTYTITDGRDTSEEATVYLTIGPVNDNPVAVDDSFSAYAGKSLEITAAELLANDSDIDLDLITIQSVTNPTYGTLEVDEVDGVITTLTYTLNTLDIPEDSFTYTITDNNGGTSTATVFLTINVMEVIMNFRPDSDLNNINIDGGDGDVKVGIYSDGAFDASTVDPASIRVKGLLSNGVPEPPVSWKMQPLGGPDKQKDLVMHFRESSIPVTAEDTTVELTGRLKDGTLIKSTDYVRPL